MFRLLSAYSSAAKGAKRTHLELGGKAPVIVFDDADIEAAVSGIGEAGYFNAGQDCTAATRVLASTRVYDALWQHERKRNDATLIRDRH